MIDGLAPSDVDWLRVFFSAPNELTWDALQSGSAEADLVEQVSPWLEGLSDRASKAPVILPLVNQGVVAGWYATTRSAEGGHELGAELRAWLGPTFLSVFEIASADASNPSASALARLSHGLVWKFTGADSAAKEAIAKRLIEYEALSRWRPRLAHRPARPVGAIRSDFERALIGQDAAAAERFIAELRDTGRLNEENLRYLDVRLSAGLGLWPQIARDHWLIENLSDLALPPRILSDIIEALYRTNIDAVESGGDVAATLAAFDNSIARRYPRLFTSRRGIRTPRVVKAFLLFEQLQTRPNADVVNELAGLLDDSERIRVLDASREVAPLSPVDAEAEADEAFDDLQYDRAFAFYLNLPLSKKIIGRLVTCVQFADTDDARTRLRAAVSSTDLDSVDGLSAAMREKFEALTALPAEHTEEAPAATAVSEPAASIRKLEPQGWMEWAEHLKLAYDLAGAELALQVAVTNWSISDFRENDLQSRAFADIVGNLNGEAASLARRAVPQIFESFLPADQPPATNVRPIAELLFSLVAMNDGLSDFDLDLLSQLLTILLTLGLTGEQYRSMVADLEDVQDRVRSYANLPWNLDVCETLAVSSAQSETARSARLAFFLRVLGHAQAFAHRLGPQDFLPIELLARDFEIDDSAVDALRRHGASDGTTIEVANLSGKLIGIYTLAEAAGARAKASLQAMFPGCNVEVNSDLVATEKLRNLARTAELFVFAWKSSSHAAFFCIKAELPTGREPIWAAGKGTASILRAVLDNIS